MIRQGTAPIWSSVSITESVIMENVTHSAALLQAMRSSLGRFFERWIYGFGVPTVKVGRYLSMRPRTVAGSNR